MRDSFMSVVFYNLGEFYMASAVIAICSVLQLAALNLFHLVWDSFGKLNDCN